MKSTLAPTPGAIVRVWFPESESVMQPGPKFRPVLVLAVCCESNEGPRALVAYGTSQRTDRYSRGEVVVPRSLVPSLECDTKFCLTKAIWLPLSREYFSSNGRQPAPTPFPLERLPNLRQALEESGLKL